MELTAFCGLRGAPGRNVVRLSDCEHKCPPARCVSLVLPVVRSCGTGRLAEDHEFHSPSTFVFLSSPAFPLLSHLSQSIRKPPSMGACSPTSPMANTRVRFALSTEASVSRPGADDPCSTPVSPSQLSPMLAMASFNLASPSSALDVMANARFGYLFAFFNVCGCAHACMLTCTWRQSLTMGVILQDVSPATPFSPQIGSITGP